MNWWNRTTNMHYWGVSCNLYIRACGLEVEELEDQDRRQVKRYHWIDGLLIYVRTITSCSLAPSEIEDSTQQSTPMDAHNKYTLLLFGYEAHVGLWGYRNMLMLIDE